MARIAGIDLPREKRIEIGLTYIYGIGRTSAKKILEMAQIDPDIRVKDLTEDQESALREVIDKHFTIEGDLRREVALNIKRLTEIGAMKFIEEDSAYLLRRIPAQVKAEHYHSDEVHIRDLLEESGLTPRGGIALAAATIRGLILTVSHQEQIGALYPQVLETLTRGACEELFPRA